MSFGKIETCSICGRKKSSLALKKLPENYWICSKGLCRRIYNSNKDMIKKYGIKMVLQVCRTDYQQEN